MQLSGNCPTRAARIAPRRWGSTVPTPRGFGVSDDCPTPVEVYYHKPTLEPVHHCDCPTQPGGYKERIFKSTLELPPPIQAGLQESEVKALSSPRRTARRTVEYTKPTTNNNGANTRLIGSDIFSVPMVRNSTKEPRSDSGNPKMNTHTRRNSKTRTIEKMTPQAAARTPRLRRLAHYAESPLQSSRQPKTESKVARPSPFEICRKQHHRDTFPAP